MKKNGGQKKEERTKKKWINYELRIFLYLFYLLSFSSSNSTHVLFEVFLAKDEKCKGGTRRRGRKNEQRRMQQLWISRYGIVYNRSAQEKFLFFFFFLCSTYPSIATLTLRSRDERGSGVAAESFRCFISARRFLQICRRSLGLNNVSPW